ncbi:MAG: hypothetical protein ABI417_22160 [Coleofasciculaceae cyanobacterium]
MRLTTLTVCSLTVLLAAGISAQASEIPTHQIAIEPLPTQDDATMPVALEKSLNAISLQQRFAIAKHPVRVIAPPENLERQPLLPKPAVAPPQNPTLKAQTVAEATPKVLAESPKAEAALFMANQASAEALRPNQVIAQSSTDNNPATTSSCNPQPVSNTGSYQLAQANVNGSCPRPEAIPPIVVPQPVSEFEASPALSIYIPVGYGADRNTVFLSGSYQSSVRKDRGDVGAAGIGIGLGNAAKTVGVELSYALETSENFGEGGFNAKVHRQLGQDLAGAVGWNGFLNFGRNDFEQSKYGVITKIFRTQPSLNSAFSRVSVTAGVGDGQFRSNGAVKAGDNNVNVFGNVAVRVIRPVSLIAEWTGQDLALGLSIAPFKNLPFVITPAVRDLAGAGDGARFVLGAGTAFRF